MNYTVLSPWAEAESRNPVGISPRLDTLEGKTIGLYSHFKDTVPELMQTVGQALQEKFPSIKLKHFQYVRDATELVNDPENDAAVQEWLSDVDGVIAGLGDAGSCSMYLGYNIAHIEKCGKPSVLLTEPLYMESAGRGASARSVPGLRRVIVRVPPFGDPDLHKRFRPCVEAVIDQIIQGLTAPATENESAPPQPVDYANITYTGTLGEINDIFYKNGWTTGLPIIPPTAEAVEEMLTGTDLPRDHVVAELPPLRGKATVEKIAVNAVMAGCLPTYMPLLIAAIEGMASPEIALEGWTCSNASWIPVSIVNGPIAKQIGLNSGRGVLSPYSKPNAAIPRAISYMVMNLTGCRPGLEDMSCMGQFGRHGVCFGENTDDSPWAPMHTDYGFAPEDNVLTQFWPAEYSILMGRDDKSIIREMCRVDARGWDNGCLFVVSPEQARALASRGWTQQKVLDYVVEYNRFVPGPEGGMLFNNHFPEGCIWPVGEGYSRKRFWTKKHMFIVVSGRVFTMAMTGGGDHGGPVRTRIRLPENWEALVEKYRDIVPTYFNY